MEGVPTGVWLARSHEEEGAVLVLRDLFTDVCARSGSISIRGCGGGGGDVAPNTCR